MLGARAKALIAYGSDVECGSWSKALRLMERVPTLKTLLRVAPWHEAEADRPALPDFARDFNARFPGFETDIHGLVKKKVNGHVEYFLDCVRAEGAGLPAGASGYAGFVERNADRV